MWLIGTHPQAFVSFKKYMPPPLPYFKVNIYPFPLPHDQKFQMATTGQSVRA
jgi:hypothetical protein